MELRGRIALITGASGFVGPHLARELKERGAVVYGLGPESTPPPVPLDGWHTADLREASALESAIASARPNAVFHLAGQSSAARSFENPTQTFAINTLGTWNLLEAVRRVSPEARVLIVGTSEVYGPQPEGSRVTETAPYHPVSPYAMSKATADAMADVYASQHGLDVVRTRSFGHIGSGQAPQFVVPSFAQQIAAMEAGRTEPVLRVGNLDVTRDLTDVRDVVRAYAALIDRGRSGAAYNVCRGVGVRLSDVARMLIERARVAIRVEVDPARLRPADVPYLVGDPGRIASETGWQAEIPIERTLEEVLREWRERVT